MFDCSGGPGEPLVAMEARAAILEDDLQENTDRWVRDRWEWIPEEHRQREWYEAVWYWVRLYVSLTPLHIWWWPDGDLERSPHEWSAVPARPDHSAASAPSGRQSTPSPRPDLDIESEIERVAAFGFPPPTLTLSTLNGHPVPFRTLRATRCHGGFELDVPSTAPWTPAGPAFLSFVPLDGMPTGVAGRFIGQARPTGHVGRVQFTIEKAIRPAHLEVLGPDDYLFPPPSDREELLGRLQHELDRRGAVVPTVRPPDA